MGTTVLKDIIPQSEKVSDCPLHLETKYGPCQTKLKHRILEGRMDDVVDIQPGAQEIQGKHENYLKHFKDHHVEEGLDHS